MALGGSRIEDQSPRNTNIPSTSAGESKGGTGGGGGRNDGYDRGRSIASDCDTGGSTEAREGAAGAGCSTESRGEEISCELMFAGMGLSRRRALRVGVWCGLICGLLRGVLFRLSAERKSETHNAAHYRQTDRQIENLIEI
jgi:hypothetical protein